MDTYQTVCCLQASGDLPGDGDMLACRTRTHDVCVVKDGKHYTYDRWQPERGVVVSGVVE